MRWQRLDARDRQTEDIQRTLRGSLDNKAAGQRFIWSAGLRTPDGPRLRTCV